MGIFLYLRWRRLRLEEKFLKELMTYNRPSDAHELENGGNRNNLPVYSVGEIKTATNGFSLANKLGEVVLVRAYKAWELWKVDPLKLVDLAIMESAIKDQVLKFINVSLLCVEHNPCDRPTMSDVISMLASDVNQLPSPKQPAFYNVERNSIIENSTKEQTQVNCSANQLSLTEMVGR
ncbi:hypothetical protein K2173_013729 [Erythroxylum novogranatense]|uniref:Uncharacterized protein n=1 Tax=Erythroxylum novogranatense TaxID=1862640 RepID=A0AAV8SA78_9ROSI|nr:hypothetical protein K2173_013729 [Erythroxylum novogranatense]